MCLVAGSQPEQESEPIALATELASRARPSRMKQLNKAEAASRSSAARQSARSRKLTKDSMDTSSTTSNSSYLAEERSNEILEAGSDSELGKSARKQPEAELVSARKTRQQVAKTAALVLAPSIESIAMRIVSSAASKSIGRPRSAQTHHKLGSSAASGSTESFLSTLSSSLISAALTQLVNLNATLSSSGSSGLTPSSPSPSLWPGKLSPLLHSLASLSGLSQAGDEPSSSSSILNSFLSSYSSPSSGYTGADLSSSSSSVQPTSILQYNSPSFAIGAGNKPHSPKQYSPTMLGIVNLARYVLCKYNSSSIDQRIHFRNGQRPNTQQEREG